MKKALIVVFLVLVAGFVIIQFYQPEKNEKSFTENDIFNRFDIPPNVENILRNSCYDCHSNQTRYPWYNNIAPVSWMIANHVKEGKEELNFSEWGQLSKRKQISALNKICEVIEDAEMPLPGYLKMHKEAVLKGKQIEEICTWTQLTSKEILRK